MTWRSLINDFPDEENWEGDPLPMNYLEWLGKVMQEPWVEALWSLVQWSGVWVGTEAELIRELKMRVDKEVSTSPDFPSSLERLMAYQDYAIDGFLTSRLGILDFRELTEEDLEDFDVPGWGPDATVLVKAGDACYRPDFWDVQFKLLKYWHPFPVGVFMFTDSKKFPKQRTWHGTSKELSQELMKHYPTYRNIPWLPLDRARPEGVDDIDPWPGFATEEELAAMDNLGGTEGPLVFYKLMRKWAPILKEEARIEISWQKRRGSPQLPETFYPEDVPLKTYWTIQAPRWDKPDLSHAWGSRPDLKNTRKEQEDE
jgi:hypothetical protein